MRIGVLASGTGSLFEAIVDDGIDIALLLSDRPCRALDVATERGIATELVERTEWGRSFDRDAYSQLVVDALERHEIDLAVSAGFGSVVPAVAAAFRGRYINTHPALLPSFKGWHAVRDALASGVKVTGCTVHLCTEVVDDGPILAQEAVPVLPGDTEESLHERIKAVERRLLPQTIRQFINGEITVEESS